MVAVAHIERHRQHTPGAKHARDLVDRQRPVGLMLDDREAGDEIGAGVLERDGLVIDESPVDVEGEPRAQARPERLVRGVGLDHGDIGAEHGHEPGHDGCR